MHQSKQKIMLILIKLAFLLIFMFEICNLRLYNNNSKIKNMNDNKHKTKKQMVNKIASIITLIITFQDKLQESKVKLCSFSNFSGPKSFSELDFGEKGYLTVDDLYRQCQGKVERRFIAAVIAKHNLQGHGSQKLGYFGYINMIKPYFDSVLSADLLSRGQLNRGLYYSHQQTNNTPEYPNIQQTVKKLLRQLIVLHCIFSSQHEQIKETMLEQYRLSPFQILSIIEQQFSSSKNVIVGNIKMMHGLLQKYSPHLVDEKQVKMVLSFCRCTQAALLTQKNITIMLMPCNIQNNSKISQIANYQPLATQKVEIQTPIVQHLNQQDINYKTTSFLGYIHPKSVIPISQQLKQYHQISSKPQKQIINHQSHPSAIIQTNQYQIQQYTKNTQLYLPILQQFMKPDNIVKNMSYSQKMYQPNPIHNSIVADQSSAFQVVDYNYNQKQQSYQITSKDNHSEVRNIINQKLVLNHSKYPNKAKPEHNIEQIYLKYNKSNKDSQKNENKNEKYEKSKRQQPVVMKGTLDSFLKNSTAKDQSLFLDNFILRRQN